ncbi:MAG: glycosyltransferase family 39 protein [Bauldia sp.]|nr:glycosyltransferase family 39 protein [Bauldia sp.]
MTIESVAIAAGDRSTDARLLRAAIGLTLGLLALRLLVIGQFGLFFDEAYYWLWSTQPAAGYFDHPPVVAFAIRLGTILFGETEFGVRFFGAVSLVGIVALIYAITRTLTDSPRVAAWAAIFANLTTISALTIVSVPDQAQILFWLAAMLAVAKLARGGDPRWWLLAGAMFGLSVLSKYAAFFLAAGVFLWLIAVPLIRASLRGPWPYLGAALGLLVLAPNLAWNASHGWASFVVQSQQNALDTAIPLSIAGYLALIPLVASPPIFVLAAIGLVRTLRAPWRRDPVAALLVLLPLPLLLYLLFHAARDEVEFHWLSPVAFWSCILAARVLAAPLTRVVAVMRVIAVGLGIAVTVLIYFLIAQRFIAMPPAIDLGARFSGWREFTERVDALRIETGADYIIGNRYYYPGYFRFYLDDPPPVFHLHNPDVDGTFGVWSRWADFPAADPGLADSTAIFIGKEGRGVAYYASLYFDEVEFLGRVERPTGRDTVDIEFAYAVRNPKPFTAPLFNGWQETGD